MLPFSVPFIRWADVARMTTGTMRRRIYDHEFVYVLGGQGTIVIEGARHTAEHNRLFLLQPRQWHGYHAAENAELLLLGVHFDWKPQHDTLHFPIFRAADEGQFAEDALFRVPREVPGWNLRQTPFLDCSRHSRVRKMLEDVVAEYARDDAESREVAGALLAAAIGQIAREVRVHAGGAMLAPDALRRCERARAMLEDVEALPSTEDVALAVGWSADHLRRAFRAAFNTTPQGVQMAARLRRGRELLRDGNIPVAEVAHRCGFDDPSHFARAFRAETGLSPREFLTLVCKL
ncbi:MAG TPA: AraC family transcriptional regulator [Abditibacteriaceae bacterium]|jgi:AraC-like DNA-binding protein